MDRGSGYQAKDMPGGPCWSTRSEGSLQEDRHEVESVRLSRLRLAGTCHQPYQVISHLVIILSTHVNSFAHPLHTSFSPISAPIRFSSSQFPGAQPSLAPAQGKPNSKPVMALLAYFFHQPWCLIRANKGVRENESVHTVA